MYYITHCESLVLLSFDFSIYLHVGLIHPAVKFLLDFSSGNERNNCPEERKNTI